MEDAIQTDAEFEALRGLLDLAASTGAQVVVTVGDRTVAIPSELAAELQASLIADRALALPPEITTGQAADLLGVSRPTVVALIDRGELSAVRVGNRRRLRASAVLAYRASKSTQQDAALDELAAESEKAGLYGQ